MPALRVDGRLSPALSAQRATFVTLTAGRQAARLHRIAGAETSADRGRGDERGAGGLRRSALSASRAKPNSTASRSTSRSSPIRGPVPAASEAELVAALEPDRDGLILGAGRRRALFLPSVWRQVADPREFVRHLMMKAGLDSMIFPLGLEAAALPGRVRSARPGGASSPAEIAPVRIEEAERCTDARSARDRYGRLRLYRRTSTMQSGGPSARARRCVLSVSPSIL